MGPSGWGLDGSQTPFWQSQQPCQNFRDLSLQKMGALEAGPPQSPIQASLCRLHWSCEELSMFSNSPAYALVFIASLQRHALQPSPLTRHSSVRPELRVELQTLWLNCTCTSGPSLQPPGPVLTQPDTLWGGGQQHEVPTAQAVPLLHHLLLSLRPAYTYSLQLDCGQFLDAYLCHMMESL